MKKLLNISVIAALAILPMAANAAVTDADPGATNADAPVATNAPKYNLAQAESNDGNLATAGYVKGAYNAAIKAVNKVATTAGNAATKDLDNLTATGKANVSAQGTYDSNTNYTAGTVGAAIKAKADAATTLAGYGITDGADTDLSNISGTGEGVIKGLAAEGGYDNTENYASGTIGATIKTLETTAGNAANQDLSNLSATGKANVSAQGTYDSSTNYTAGTVGAAIKAKADAATTLAGYGITDAYTKTETATGVLATIDAATVPVMATWGSNTATTVSVDAPANYLESAPVVP